MQDKKTGTIADIINPRNPKVLDPPPIANCTQCLVSTILAFMFFGFTYFLVFKIRIGIFFKKPSYLYLFEIKIEIESKND